MLFLFLLLFVLVYSGLFVFLLFACLFPKMRAKEVMEMDGWMDGDDLGGDERKETEIRTYYLKK